MDYRREFEYILKLLNLKKIKKEPYSLSGFAKILEVSENNTGFRNWLKELIEKNILVKIEEKDVNGRVVNFYKVDIKCLEKYFEKNLLYDLADDYFSGLF